MLGNGIAKKCVALFRPVAMECIGGGLVVDSSMECLDRSLADGAGDITYAHTDYVGFGVSLLVVRHFLCYIREEIGWGQLREIVVDLYHSGFCFEMPG